MNKFWKIIYCLISVINAISCIVLLFVICPRVINHENLEFDYMGVIIGILSLLVTVLLGWNIWTVIDSKGLERKVQRELNYVHNKIDYDLGLIYGYFSQMLGMNISALDKQALKVHMLEYMVNSLKILSKMPNTSIEINGIANTIASVMVATKSITIDIEDAQHILERLGEIENREEITSLDIIRAELLLHFKHNEP